MTQEMEKKLEELLADQEEMGRVFVADPEQTRANLASRGIEMSSEEFAELCAGILDGMGISTDGELDEKDLENVAGGFGGIALVACCTAAVLICGGYSFFKGYSNGLKDANNGVCRKAGGGIIYSAGHRTGQRIGGCYC